MNTLKLTSSLDNQLWHYFRFLLLCEQKILQYLLFLDDFVVVFLLSSQDIRYV